tara:strand:+ start:472 stop:921 length:450 start_codon:yes stop_codon:yes gene_type:complete
MTNQMDLFKPEHSIDDSKGTKVCHQCNLEKPLSSFQHVAYRKDGTIMYKNFCKACKQPHAKFLTEMKRVMSVPEEHACPICNSTLEQLTEKLNPLATNPQTFVLDHDHDTMTVRDYLCNKCNSALGNFNDDVNLLRSAVSYLEKHEKKC